MEGKVCVVTGATAGIGRVAAAALARKGATLVLVGRDPDKGRRVIEAMRRDSGNERLSFECADLSRQAAIRALADRLHDRLERIDVLLNNAGALYQRRRESVDGIEMTFALNHLGYFLLTGLVLDLVAAGPSARIVNVSSAAHRGPQVDLNDPGARVGYKALRAYQQSKLANIHFTYALASRLEGITVNCLHPGFVATKFGHNNRSLFGLMIRIAQMVSAINETEGAKTSIHLASSPEVSGTTGRYFDKCRPCESSAESHDASVRERLWALSESLTGFVYP